MKFKRNVVIEVSENNMTYSEYSNSLLNKLKRIVNKTKKNYELRTLKDFKVDIKGKNLYVIVEGEEVYIKKFILPKVKESLIRNLVKDELSAIFINIEDIVFTYNIVEKHENSIEVIVFCLNSDRIDKLREVVHKNSKLVNVNLIQFYFLSYFKSKINAKIYIFILKHNKDIYFMACKNNIVIANNIIKNYYDEEVTNSIREFIKNSFNLIKPNNFEKIYFSNIVDKELIKNVALSYECEDFGYIDKEQVIIKYANNINM